MKTYVVKIALRGISPMVWRRFRLSGETLDDEMTKTLALVNAIIHANETTTVGEIRPWVEALDAVRFNRPKVNRQLN
ncbi:hypothetical protein [Xenorhabdus anantnagensis]|uniref:Uncharacterized protein n=1 Tax=Xenorhabdus anantnagensis TaxID=3025875 RepID=A0ABT5LVV3_9GAMM|nr:hypothetical protein [Xenorhabdus anantnagensis]MDC9598556.1 hypothetical protein [Xenorhabdus anantnagensis]